MGIRLIEGAQQVVFLFQCSPISWCSKKQPIVALSNCEAEYMVGAVAACQAIWLISVLSKLGIEAKKPVTLLINNRSSISLVKNPVSHGRNKHIETKFHFRDQVQNGVLELIHCSIQLQVADILTKGVKTDQFVQLRTDLGVVSFETMN